MKTVNDYPGFTDSDRIERAIAERENGRVLIPPRSSQTEPERDYWLIDRAIVIPEDTTVVLRNCRIKLSDSCRDNFFRSANCGMGIENPAPIRNLHIRGEGLCVLEGADHPRSTGDGSKALSCPCPKLPEDILRLADWISDEIRASGKLGFWDEHSNSYGTDAGKAEQSQYGDWRNVSILFANVTNFSISNLRMVCYHGWGISLEECSFGRIEKMEFDANMSKEIDGMLHNIENQDGIDLRNGCHDIFISDITGGTGDDIVALTAIADTPYIPGGSLCSTHVMHNDWSRRDRNIYNIVIRGVMGFSKGGVCSHIRLLPAQAKIWNVVIDGVVDTSPPDLRGGGVLLLGERDGSYGANEPGSLTGITISNVICNSHNAVLVRGYLQDSSISNVVNRNPACPVITVCRKDGLKNVQIAALTTVGKSLIADNF